MGLHVAYRQLFKSISELEKKINGNKSRKAKPLVKKELNKIKKKEKM